MKGPPIDCQRCGALIVTSQWREHLADHESGKVPTLPVEEALRINAIARDVAPLVSPEDFDGKALRYPRYRQRTTR